MTKLKENKDLLLKGLLYRSIHRGCKETDILIGEFAKDKINKFNDDELTLFDNFIKEDDAEIYDWILNKSNFPEQYSQLILEIREFHSL